MNFDIVSVFQVVLVAYTPAEPVDGLAVEAEKGLLCVWDSKQPRAPVKSV